MASRVIPSAIKPYQVTASAKHSATVIFLHGLGDTGAGWLPFAEMAKSHLPHVKWVLPNAPHRNITINMGMSMPGWFDLYSLDWKIKAEDREGMLASASTVDELIKDETDAGIPPERIVIGGFSQGGCISLLAGLVDRGQGDRKLGGVVVLSGWMPLREEFPNVVSVLPFQTRDGADEPSQMVSRHLTNMPVLMCHGTADPLVPYDSGLKTKEILKSLGLPILGEGKLGEAGLSFKAYNGLQHSTCQEEVRDVIQFLEHVLPPQ